VSGDGPPGSWVPVPARSPFPLENLPYGVFCDSEGRAHVGAAIGAAVLDLAGLAGAGLLEDSTGVFARSSLNAFMASGPAVWASVRGRLTELLSDPAWAPSVSPFLRALDAVRLQLPFEVADYVDFYSFVDHARNMGRILRPGADPLTRNWRHLPIGYHGRAGTVVVSGTPVVRPSGQRLPAPGEARAKAGSGASAQPGEAPVFGPSAKLDFEAEVGFVVGVGSRPGRAVTPEQLTEHVFGVVLVDDWSARDLQAWESVPLGPFTGKSFATSISPWVVPLAALAPARVDPPTQRPPPLPYLRDPDPWSLEVTLEVRLNGHVVSRPPVAAMYWTPGQQMAHLTANGAGLRTGDLLASGTVSGPAPDQRGSLIELAWNGTSPLTLADGSRRSFLEDGDTVAISGWARGAHGVPIGFGPVAGTVLPAAPPARPTG
jgi:fumarylacetoacetase